MSVRHLLAWPGLVATVSLTIYGNLTIAQPSAGGYISHATAPAIYLILATLLLHSGEMHSRSRRYVYVGMAGIAMIALVVSYDGLYTAAVHWGWDVHMAYAYPVLVDFGVLAFTAYLDGTKSVHVPSIVPSVPVHVPSMDVPSIVPSRRTATTGRVHELHEAYGTDSSTWPGPTEIAAKLGWPKSSAASVRNRALALEAS